MWILLVALVTSVKVTSGIGPSFEVPVVNVTVIEGVTAVLPCSVTNLGAHKVVWTDQWSTILAFMENRIIDDKRYYVDTPYPNNWNLHISGVKYDDQGIYTCQVNTNPVKLQTVVLDVLVPPRFIGGSTESDVIVKEKLSVSLICNVTGIPRPTVTWYKSPSDLSAKKESEFCTETSRIGFSGEILVIHNVTRFCGGMYECIAENGVPPSVTRHIQVSVEFPPEIRLPNKRIGQVRGKDTILECVVTAYPQAVSVWKFKGKALPSSGKYTAEVFEEGDYTITLSLRVSEVNEDDYGQYTCVASNSMGKESKKMTLYEHIIPTKPPTTTSTSTTTTAPTSKQPSSLKDDVIVPKSGPDKHSDSRNSKSRHHNIGNKDRGDDEIIDPVTRLKPYEPVDLPDSSNDPVVVAGTAGSRGPKSGAVSKYSINIALVITVITSLTRFV